MASAERGDDAAPQEKIPMKAKKRVDPKQAQIQGALAKQTRQGVHQITQVLEPAFPDWAKWQVLEWSVAISTWQHYGFARNEADRTRLADAIRALGGKVKYVGRSKTVGRGPTSAGPRTPLSPPTASAAKTPVRQTKGLIRPTRHPVTPAFRRAFLSSTIHWLRVVSDVRKDTPLPLELLIEVRDACNDALKSHRRELERATSKDPLKPYTDDLAPKG